MKTIRGIKVIINTMTTPFKRLYVIIGNICCNIKYLCTKNIDIELIEWCHQIEHSGVLRQGMDKLSNRITDMDARIDDVMNDVENKCDEYQVEDVIYNQIGCVDDLATYDDINEVKGDTQVLKDDLKNDVKYLTAYCKELKQDIINNKTQESLNEIDGFRDSNGMTYEDKLIEDVINNIINRLSTINNYDNV